MLLKSFFKKVVFDLPYFLRNDLSKLFIVVIEITNRCTLDCVFCFNKVFKEYRKSGEEMEYNCIKDIIDNISFLGIKRIKFSGGEPLLREDILDLLAYSKSKGLEVWLNTNATLIDKAKIARLSMSVDNVLVPLNAYNLLTEFSVTKKYLFKRKLRGIKLLNKSGIKIVRVGTVLTKFNIKNLEKINELIERLQIKTWQLFRPIPIIDNSFPICAEDVANLVEKLLVINKHASQNYKIFNAIPFCAYDPEKMSKVAVGAKFDDGHSLLVVNTHGIVRPMYYIDEYIGNVLISKDFRRLWSHKFMQDMRNLKFVPYICRKCKYLNICLGGSRAVSKILNKSFSHLDYLAQPLKYKRQLFNE